MPSMVTLEFRRAFRTSESSLDRALILRLTWES